MALSRRRFLDALLAAPVVLAAHRARGASDQALQPLDPRSPEARAVAYVEDGASAEPRAAGNRCASCALYGGAAGSVAGACQLFTGKQVRAKGWCSAWAPQM